MSTPVYPTVWSLFWLGSLIDSWFLIDPKGKESHNWSSFWLRQLRTKILVGVVSYWKLRPIQHVLYEVAVFEHENHNFILNLPTVTFHCVALLVRVICQPESEILEEKQSSWSKITNLDMLCAINKNQWIRISIFELSKLVLQKTDPTLMTTVQWLQASYPPRTICARTVS